MPFSNQAKSDFYQALKYIQARQYPEAFRALKQPVSERMPVALTNLGVLLLMKVLPYPSQEILAVRCLELAAQTGCKTAAFNLSRCYFAGRGIAVDWVKAFAYLKESAEKGHSSAQYHLGLAYLYGNGVKQSSLQGCFWLKKSADDGFAKAQFKMAQVLMSDEWLLKDLSKALLYFNLAQANNHPQAAAAIDSLSEIVSDEEVCIAKRLQDKWGQLAEGNQVRYIKWDVNQRHRWIRQLCLTMQQA
jgi:TPR repeat protein